MSNLVLFSSIFYKSLLFSCVESFSVREAQTAEGMILYHFDQSANLGTPIVKHLLKTMKGVVSAPDLVVEPFLLTVLLSLSSVPSYEELVRVTAFKSIVIIITFHD